MFFCNKFNREKTYPFFINNDTHEIGCLFKNLFMYIFYKINVLLHERHNFMQQLVIFFYIFPLSVMNIQKLPCPQNNAREPLNIEGYCVDLF